MKTQLLILLTAGLAGPLGCGLFDDDVPPAAGGSGGEIQECIDTWDLSQLQDVCESPYAPQLTVSLEGDDIFWVDDPMNATSVGAGWIFGNVASADWLGYIVQGDAECGVACVMPQGHPCLADGNFSCSAGEQSPGCFYCGPGTAADCESFVDNACDGPAGGGDSTSGVSTSGGADEGGDSTGAGAVAPDVSMFTSHPDDLFGTTQLVLDNLGSHAPANLVAEDLCAIWDPAAAVSEWFGDPILEKEVFNQVIDDAEKLLGYCDHLQLGMHAEGVEIVSTDRNSLAYELGFRGGDVIISLNGVAATDPLALREELISISHQSPGLGTLLYRRGANMQTMRVKVQ